MDWKQLATDFKQKYEHCWCLVKLEDFSKEEVFYLSEVEVREKEAPWLSLENNTYGEITLKYDVTKSDIEFKMPEVGLHQFDTRVVYLRKEYFRQWKAGLCKGTMTAVDIYSDLLEGGYIEYREPWEEPLVRTVFAPQKPLLIKEALNQLAKKAAVALSRDFALGQPLTESEQYIIFYRSNPIGFFNPHSRQVVLKESQFEQEFQDFLRNINETAEYAYYR